IGLNDGQRAFHGHAGLQHTRMGLIGETTPDEHRALIKFNDILARPAMQVSKIIAQSADGLV
ncbi:MAG TPA: hypothetical protein P5330_04725, partial [Candidatus Competibacteraceae bacterium]|nr:hypothetical protein [Candidatus Competibacteraceae bacterium]